LTGIDLSLLAGLPGLIALIVCIRRGPEQAFMNVYLPSLLLLPDACRMSLSGQFNFAESAIIPIAAFYLWREGKNWKWCFTDLVVLAFAALTTISEYMNSDYWLAQHLALGMTTTTILPYVVARGLVARDDLSAEVAKKIVILATFVAIVSLYEFRMTSNLFRHVMSPLFQEHSPEIPALRYGFVRIAGPWTHPILAGIIFAVTYRIARWLEWTRTWSGNVPFLPISKVRFCELSLLAGSVMTISRGPWIGAIVAALIVFLFRVRHRSYVTAFAVAAVFILMVPAYSSFDAYVNVNRAGSHDEAEDSAAYRKQMIQEYILIAEERPTWGWGVGRDGKALYPIVEGMESIDNHYLLVALTSGMYALAAMVLILLWTPLRLLGFVLRRSPDDPTTTLGVTLLGIFIILIISISTSWLGAQTQPLLFMIAGWSEGLLVAPLVMTAKAPSAVRRVTYRFERVMV
jgi:hypothetical protein